MRNEAAIGLPGVSTINAVTNRPTSEVGVRFQITWIRLPPSALGEIAAETWLPGDRSCSLHGPGNQPHPADQS